MRMAVIVAALAALWATSAAAEVSVRSSRLPCVKLESGGLLCGTRTEIGFRPGEGDTKILALHGFRGIDLVGLPSFLREVPTGYGRALHGIPEAGTYVIQMNRDGKRIPTLDLHLRFTDE